MEPTADERSPQKPPDLAGKKILVVEDYANSRTITRYFLQKTGCEVTVAEDGQGAVDRCAETAFDLVLMDIQMPRLDGLAATRRIRAIEGRDRMPIIGMTANAYRSDREKCMTAGMNDVLIKPFRRLHLFEMVARWIDHSLPE